MKKNLSIATLTLLGAFASSAQAQVASASSSANTTLPESTQIAAGWSVTKTLLGKTIYNDAGQKVGNVEDLIISRDKSVSYIIVGAQGFVGVGRHDVAIPVAQVQDQSGKLVIPGATKEMIKSMPVFDHAYDSTKRDQFVANAEQDISSGKAKVADLENKNSALSADAKTRMDVQIAALQVDVKAAEARLDEMKQATANRRKEFEARVSAATARLRKAVETG